MLMRQPFDLKFRFGVVGKTMYTIGGLLQKLKVNYFPTDKTTQIQRQVLEKWPNMAYLNSYCMTVFNTKEFAQKLLRKGGDEYHMHLGLHADSQSSKPQHFTSLAVLEKGQKKPPTSLYWEGYSPTCWKYLWVAFFWGPEKHLFRKQKITKVMGKANARHKFLSTSFNPGRRQHFTVRKLYLQKKSTEETIMSLFSGRPRRVRLKLGKQWRDKRHIVKATRQ